MKVSELVAKSGFWVVAGAVFLLPLFFLPITSEFYEFNKNFLLIAASATLLLLLAVNFVVDRQVKILRSPFGLPLLAILVSWLLSTVLRSPNRVDALMDPGQTGTILALCIFFMTAINFVRSRKEMEILAYSLIASLGVLGLTAVLWGSGLMPKMLPASFLKSALWTPTGSPISTIVALVAGLPFVVTLLAREKKLTLVSGFLALTLLLQVAGAGLIGWQLLKPENRPLFLSQQAGWSIALEAAKQSPLLGTGPSTFLYDFTQFRPVSYNLSSNWAFRFSNSSNYYLQLLATVGFLGLAAYLFLVARSYMVLVKSLRGAHNPEAPLSRIMAIAGTASATLLFASQLFVPASVVSMALSIMFLVIATVALKQAGSSLVTEANIDIVAGNSTGYRSPLLPWISLVFALLLIVPSLYLAARVYAGEIYFQNALVAAGANDGKKTYDTLLLAMRQNPYRDAYRVIYSQTNLLLANSIAGNKNLTEADRTTVTQLIQQSIQEAKNAVALNPAKVSNVENLATIYRNLLNLAQGADQWTVASYRQAITLDPVNPNLRIAMGGVLYSLKSYDDAITFFQQAADLKPDLANAYYNLSSAYEQKGDNQKAYNAMQNVVQLVDKSSADYTKATQQLDALRQKLGSAAPANQTSAATPSTLTTPAPIPSAAVSPKIALPANLAPEAPATPSSNP